MIITASSTIQKISNTNKPHLRIGVMTPLLPLRDVIVFPKVVVPLFVGRDRSVKALEYAMAHNRKIFLAAQKDPNKDDPSIDSDIYNVGTMGTVLQLLKLPDGTVKALVEGNFRGRINNVVDSQGFYMVDVIEIETENACNNETSALFRVINESFAEYAKLSNKIGKEVLDTVASIDDPARFADTIAGNLSIKLSEKQTILETVEINPRLYKLLEYVGTELDILRLENRLKIRVKEQIDKTQKDYYLNEQMRAIQKEMGGNDDFKAEIDELEKRIKRKKLSKEAHAKVKHELKKLKMMTPTSAEGNVVRNYIDWILSLPWYDKSKISFNVDRASEILEEDHYGLEKPKERILEYLAVQSLTKNLRGPILCFVGPPGVGKTSLAKSVARATDRNFIRLSLGGVRDEAEIRGHRRTYIGALPGKIIQSIKKAKTNNPVFCLDEVDKMSTDFRGDPSSALLEVLDPEQNYAFNDHYLDLDYDLSDVFFITTANSLHGIPLPLQDRMEIINVSGYTEIEKLHIANQFLLPKQMEANGLTGDDISFSDRAILKVVRLYTKESGVRNLERELGSICRKVAKSVAKNGRGHKVAVNEKSVSKYLGIEKFRFGLAEEKDLIGVATGLAWTEFGGDLLQIEVTIMPGGGQLQLTGKLGDVMQESAKAALSYVRTKSQALKLPIDFYDKVDIHVHVPEGAIPKDGPSAGVTLTTAIVSALIQKPVDCHVAMTGEITLRGRVLPIGGLKEKVLAAHRGGISKIIIPADNKKDIENIPLSILKKIEFVFVENVAQVLKEALVLAEGDQFLVADECAQVSVLNIIGRKKTENVLIETIAH